MRNKLGLFGILACFGAVGVQADPMPYDSIGNPLNNLPATDATVQRKGDSLNLVPNRVRVNQAGYRLKDVAAGYAKFYYVGTGITFNVVNNAGVTVATGNLATKGGTVSGQINPYASNSAEHATGGNGDWKTGYPMTGKIVSGTLMQGVIPATVPAGQYRIKVGADTSVPFVVSDNVYAMARDAALKFFGVARSGDYESWFHPASHMWDGWLFDSAATNPDGTYKYKGALKGGWYDCGNHLKEARTISYPLATLGMLASTMHEKDADRYALNQNNTLRTDGIPDVLREAWVGSRFVFNSWRLAKGRAADMILSVGDPGPDFGWWGRPENQDAVLSLRRGGRRERVLLKNWGSGSMGDFAAGLAFTSRMYRPYDPLFADSALTIAKAMYEQAKTSNKAESAPDYSGDAVLYDDMALAAVALLWATQDQKYLADLTTTKGMPNGNGGVCGASGYGQGFETTRFPGGFMGCGSDGLKKNGGPTDYGSVNTLVLYSFAKLILVDPDTAKNYGIAAALRDTLLLRVINTLPGPTWGQQGNATFQIPVGGQYDPPLNLSYDSTWYGMGQGYGKTGWWNKYQFGNLADLYMYYDATSLVDGRTILSKPGSTDWKRKDVLKVLLGGLNYMFGTNALDISYLYGIGRKNPMHPHHRGSNPEGKNVPGAYYNYRIPVGGLYGGIMGGPSFTETLKEYFDTPVGQTEANCPDAQAAVMIPLMGLASEAPVAPPMPTVKVLYTTDTMAVVQVDLDKWGSLLLGYGVDSSLASQTKVVLGGDTGNTFRVQINGLKPGTQYFFHVTAKDLVGLTSTVSKWPNGKSDSVAFNFTTKAVPPVPPRFGNIKVCNVTSDSAEILWYTPNGQYLSSVLWADSANWLAAKYSVTDSDAVGNVPVQFHRVKLHGLKPKTTYEFKVGVPGSYDATVGCFRTPNEDVKFEIKTTQYTWGGKPALGIAVVNQDVKDYDSLQIRLYVNGTAANIVDLAARVDIAFKYRSDGFIDSGLFAYTKGVSKSRPRKIDPTCPDASVCAWYFDLPMYGATMESQARWRLDVIFDKHLLQRDSTDILNLPPTHDPFAGTDWSFRPHLAGSDNGLSPVDYAGVPVMGKEDIDNKTMDIPVNPYIAVYRRNEFVYGFSPFAAEQATKRTVYAMNATFDAPFDVGNGNTIQLGNGTSTRLKGTLDAYDVMLPANKGYITAIWVNGTPLSDAQRRAALSRQTDGTWKVDLPTSFAAGTNKFDVTFFAGSDSNQNVVVNGCDEGKGCAFYDANWYVNYSSNLTPAVLQMVDGKEKSLGLVTPDSSVVRIRVKDGNANLSKTVADQIAVTAVNLRTGAKTLLVLSETGPSTGVFETNLLSATSSTPVGVQLQLVPGDTMSVTYLDASDSTDVATGRLWAQASWPSLVSGAIVAGCGTSTVVARLDKPLGAKTPTGPQLLSNADFEDVVPSTVAEYYNYSGTLGGWRVDHVDLVGGLVPTLPAARGSQSLDLNDVISGSIGQSLKTNATGLIRLSLQYSTNTDPASTAPALRQAVIQWNGKAVDTLTWDLASEPTRSWKRFSVDLQATGKDTIAIRSTSPGNAGIMLDDISIMALSGGSSGGGGAGDSILGGNVVLTGVSGNVVSKKVVSGSDVRIGPSGLDLSIDPGISNMAGVSGGTLDLRIRTKSGKEITTSIVLKDSIGPWIDSAKIVENLTGNPVDTLYLWNSETLRPMGSSLPVVLDRNGVSSKLPSLAADTAWLSDPVTGRWTYVVRGGAIKAHDSIRWISDRTLETVFSEATSGVRMVFKIEGGSAAPEIRDSLVVVRNASAFRADLYLRRSPISEHADNMAYQASNHRVFGHNDSLNYDYWLDLDSIPGKAVEWYRYPAIGLLGPNVWNLSRVDYIGASGAGSATQGKVSAPVVDLAGNAALDCPSLLREVKLITRPAPFSRAWISDADGDTRADRVKVVFRKVVSAKELPDSVQIRFGSGNDFRSMAVGLSMVSDSVLTLDLPGPFVFGATRGAASDGSGSILFWKGGASTGPYSMADSVGPALISAGITFGGSYDTLELAFSEPVGRGTGAGWLVGQSVGELSTSVPPDSLGSTRWRLPVVSGAVVAGDSVRILSTNKWIDAATRRNPSAKHPWIPVSGGERAPLRGWYEDADGDGRVDQAVVVFGRTPRTRPGMRLLWPNASGGLDTAVIDSGSWNLGADGVSTTISVGPFARNITSTDQTNLGRWLSATTSRFAMDDSVSPVLTSAKLRYAAGEGDSDTLWLEWSESVQRDAAIDLVRSRSKGGVGSIKPRSVHMDPSGRSGYLLLAPDTVILRKGDSAAFLAHSVQDGFGNASRDRTVWVPVQFGLRPTRLEFKLSPFIAYSDWTLRKGDPIQLWVRARGDDGWVRPDGTPVDESVDEGTGPHHHLISATLTMNRVMAGWGYIYDNAGVFVGSVNFSSLLEMAAKEKLPTDGAGMFQVKINWDGRRDQKRMVSSGVYFLRLILKDDSPDNPHGVPKLINRVYSLGVKRSTK